MALSEKGNQNLLCLDLTGCISPELLVLFPVDHLIEKVFFTHIVCISKAFCTSRFI